MNASAKTRLATFASISALAISHAHGAISLTASVTDATALDYTNVVGAWNFTNSGTDVVVQGVTFFDVSTEGTTDGLTVVDGLLSDGGSFDNGRGISVTSGGTVADQTNLTALFETTINGLQGSGSASDIVLDISGLASGTYKFQILVGQRNDRRNKVIAEGVDLGVWQTTTTGSNNYLISDQVAVMDGTLNLRLAWPDTSDGDDRRTISGLIVNQIPEPSAALLGGLGALLLLRRRRDA